MRFLLLCALALVLQPRSSEASRESGQFWLDAVDFLESESDLESFEVLAAYSIEKRSEDLDLIKRVASYYLRLKNRPLLEKYFVSLSSANTCVTATRAICRDLKLVWNRNLDSVLFYEESATKLEEIRRNLENNKCSEALATAKKLVDREGDAVNALEALSKSYRCVGELQLAQEIEAAVKRVRVFGDDT